jgi:hypothetical protein
MLDSEPAPAGLIGVGELIGLGVPALSGDPCGEETTSLLGSDRHATKAAMATTVTATAANAFTARRPGFNAANADRPCSTMLICPGHPGAGPPVDGWRHGWAASWVDG